MRWPLAEALLALEARQRQADVEQYRFEQLLYAIGGRRGKPEVPRSLQPKSRPGPGGPGW